MPDTPFIITVDTEGDNLWERPREITTHNAAFLPRFQALCERFRFKPVYLTNYEMAMSEVFLDFARDAVARDACEIGMHLHAWNSPPIEPLTGDDFYHQPYLIEYPDKVMKEKIHVMTALLEEKFDRKMVSHRSGRWAFDGRYAAMLLREGYLVDCSVTPGVNWSANAGDPQGQGGSDYTSFPESPYFLSPIDVSVPSQGMLLEVPMTVNSSRLFRWSPSLYRMPVLRRFARKISPARRWLCPVPLLERRNDRAMVQLARSARARGATHMEFMLHSSDLMPGGSPSFPGVSDIERLYDQLATLFEELSTWCSGMTLKEFRDWWAKASRHSGSAGLAKRRPDRPRPSMAKDKSPLGVVAVSKQVMPE